jgi:hypothetical protein
MKRIGCVILVAALFAFLFGGCSVGPRIRDFSFKNSDGKTIEIKDRDYSLLHPYDSVVDLATADKISREGIANTEVIRAKANLLNAVADNIRKGRATTVASTDNVTYRIGVIQNRRTRTLEFEDPDGMLPPTLVKPNDFGVLLSKNIPEVVYARQEGDPTLYQVKMFRYSPGDDLYGIPRDYGAKVNPF